MYNYNLNAMDAIYKVGNMEDLSLLKVIPVMPPMSSTMHISAGSETFCRPRDPAQGMHTSFVIFHGCSGLEFMHVSELRDALPSRESCSVLHSVPPSFGCPQEVALCRCLPRHCSSSRAVVSWDTLCAGATAL